MDQHLLDELNALIKQRLAPKTFSTGSQGYHCQGRLFHDDGEYIVNVQLVRKGSKAS